MFPPQTQTQHQFDKSNDGKDIIHRPRITWSGVPSNNLPHDRLNKVSPVKIDPDPGK